jgi:FkbM family methyltransferase
MKDYSQYGEQIAILAAFETRTCDRMFLDIGAWNPVTFSNTRALWEQGWSGVMVEPSPGPMAALIEAYGNASQIVLVQAMVAREAGLHKMWITDDAVSTSVDAEHERWRYTVKFRGSIMVPAITFEDLTNRFGGFDFVNIDAEGESVSLFLRMLELGIYPTCVCLEHDSRTVEVLEASTKVGYTITLANSTNVVMVRG